MNISGVSIPAVPVVQAEPPRDAQLQSAVPEPTQSESAQNNPQADSGAGSSGARDESTTLGRHVDERV